MCAEGSCSSVVLPGLLSARKNWCRNPGRDEKTWDEKTRDEKTQDEKTWDEKIREEKTREKKHLQARAKTPCYREDSELHNGEEGVNKGSRKTDC